MVSFTPDFSQKLEERATKYGYPSVERLVDDAVNAFERLRAQEAQQIDEVFGSLPPDELKRLIAEAEGDEFISGEELEAHMDKLEQDFLARHGNRCDSSSRIDRF